MLDVMLCSIAVILLPLTRRHSSNELKCGCQLCCPWLRLLRLSIVSFSYLFQMLYYMLFLLSILCEILEFSGPLRLITYLEI